MSLGLIEFFLFFFTNLICVLLKAYWMPGAEPQILTMLLAMLLVCFVPSWVTQKTKAANRKVLGALKTQGGEWLEEDRTKHRDQKPWPYSLALGLATCLH